MPANVRLNSATLQQYLDGGHGVRADLMARAERVAENMRTNAPVVTGDYRDHIDVREEHTDRMVLRVGSTARHAHLVEARDGVAAKALDAAGGD